MDAEFEERLCEEVRRYPHLYNSSLKLYKDNQVCNNSWREIAQTLGKEEGVCRHKWKYLRDRFVKARKKLKGRTAEAGGNVSVPRIFSLLSWLSDFVRHRDRNRHLLSSRGNTTLSPPPVTSSPPPTAAPQSPLSTSSSASTSVCFSPTTTRKRKSHPTPAEDAVLRLLQQIDEAKASQREEHRFGMMVADMLAKLPVCERMEAQFEIYQLLYQKQKRVFEKDKPIIGQL